MLKSGVAHSSFHSSTSTTDGSHRMGGRSKFKDVGEEGSHKGDEAHGALLLKRHSLAYLSLLRRGGTEPESLPSSCRRWVQHPHRGGAERWSPRSLDWRCDVRGGGTPSNHLPAGVSSSALWALHPFYRWWLDCVPFHTTCLLAWHSAACHHKPECQCPHLAD